MDWVWAHGPWPQPNSLSLRQRAEAWLPCALFPGTEEAGLGSCHGQLPWALKLKEGTAGPLYRGHCWEAHGIQATELRGEVNVMLPFIKHSGTTCCLIQSDPGHENWAFCPVL